MAKDFSEMKPIKMMKFMLSNFDADSYLAGGTLEDAKLIKQYSFISLKKDTLVAKRAMISEGAPITILFEFKDGTTNIITTKYDR